MNRKTKSLIAAAALTGLVTGMSAPAFASSGKAVSKAGFSGVKATQLEGDKSSCGGKDGCKGKSDCKGQNECKGKGGCKTDKNECKGHNECKGQGGCGGKDSCGGKDKGHEGH